MAVAAPPDSVDQALVLITEWNEFRALSPTQPASTMLGRIVVDLRNVYDPLAMSQAGLGSALTAGSESPQRWALDSLTLASLKIPVVDVCQICGPSCEEQRPISDTYGIWLRLRLVSSPLDRRWYGWAFTRGREHRRRRALMI
jgi:hypothetical protein